MFAFVVAAAGGLLTYRSLMGRPQPAKAAAPTVQIVLAAKDLEVGAIIKDGDVQLGDWAGAVPVGATNKIEDLKGRGVLTPIYAKEPVIESRIAPRGAGGGLATLIPHGMRAFAVSVNEVVGVAGFVTAGSHVDLLIQGNSPGGNGNLGTLSKTLIQNLEVLSAGQDFKKDPEGKPVPVQVDHDIAKTSGTAMKYVWGTMANLKGAATPEDAPPVPAPRMRPAPERPREVALQAPPKKEQPFVMEILSGSARSETKFEKTPEVNK